MRCPPQWKPSYTMNTKWIWNWCRKVVIVTMHHRWPFEISSHISSVYWQAQQKTSHHIYYTYCYHKPMYQSISYDSPMQNPTYQPAPISAGHSILTICHWSQWYLRFKYMRIHTSAACGHTTQYIGGIWPHLQSTTSHIYATSKQLTLRGSPTPLSLATRW